MSVELTVPLRKKFQVGEIRVSAASIIRRILFLGSDPKIHVAEVDSDEKMIREDDYEVDLTVNLGLEFEIAGKRCGAYVVVVVESGNVLAAISPSLSRSPLEFVFVACVSLAIAQNQSGLITDDLHFWTDITEIEPERLIEALKLKSKIDGMDQAAAAVFEKMPKGKGRYPGEGQ